MWAQQHRVMDETAELMWALFHWFHQGTGIARIGTDKPDCKWHLARSFRRRMVLPGVSDHSVTMKSGLPSLRETLLFRPWAFANPITFDRHAIGRDHHCHELFNDAWALYPFPDELFWHASDEGTWDEEGVPCWTDSLAESVEVD